jgi:uncharacterized protein YcaQ
VTLANARRLAVTSQHLSGPRPKPVTTDAIHDLVVALGCLQLDPTAIVARNHLLVLFSRLGPFDRTLVDTLLWKERRLYEYWAHEASIVPTDDRALHMALPPPLSGEHQTTTWMTSRAHAVELVLNRLSSAESVRASDFEEHTDKYESGWGARSEISDSLGLLWLTGKIVPAGRGGGGRSWADADRWFGVTVGDVPARRDALRAAATRSLRALGVATMDQVRKHFLRRRYAGLDTVWADMEAEGTIVPVAFGIRGDWFVHAEDLSLLERIEAGDFAARTTLLSPFDNLICDRSRTERLWEFDFRLEIYVPRSVRWGYFVMPLLHGDRLIARFDLAVDRAAKRLDVIGVRWEPGWEGSKRPRRAVERAIAELATFAGPAPGNVPPGVFEATPPRPLTSQSRRT